MFQRVNEVHTFEMGPLLAVGGTASVHSLLDGQVLKLFRLEIGRAAIEHEALIVRAVRAAGAPAPEVGDIVVADGRFGLLYEHVVGKPMSEVLIQQPRRAASLGRRFARLHAQLHELRVTESLPEQHLKLEAQIKAASELPLPDRRAVLASLSTSPRGITLCHGDFHPANVMMGDTKDKVIDWTDASIGDPAADVARTVVVLMGEVWRGPGRSTGMQRALRKFCSAYLAEYEGLVGAIEPALTHWRPIVAAARLSEGQSELTPWLLLEASRCSQISTVP